MKKNHLKIIKAKNIGFCFGVKRALAEAEAFLKKNDKVYSLGPIIHNPFVVDDLSRRGLNVASSIEQAKGSCLVIRSHGISPALRQKADKYCYKVLDTTCPFVNRSHKIVNRLKRQGYKIVIAGEIKHPEVQALIELAGPEAVVVTDESDIGGIKPKNARLALVAQTTISRDKFNLIAKALLEIDCLEYRIFDTICNDVVQRQKEAKRIAKQAGVVFVVGGKNSANTKNLARICQKQGACTYHIESADALKPEWLDKVSLAGIISGASTPFETVEAVVRTIKKTALKKQKN